jgi:hypothetical protein
MLVSRRWVENLSQAREKASVRSQAFQEDDVLYLLMRLKARSVDFLGIGTRRQDAAEDRSETPCLAYPTCRRTLLTTALMLHSGRALDEYA